MPGNLGYTATVTFIARVCHKLLTNFYASLRIAFNNVVKNGTLRYYKVLSEQLILLF